MLSYQTALRLKEAGFPQKVRSVIVGNEDSFVPDPNHLDGYIYSPTLEELIESCGERFDGLYRGGELGWWATDGEGIKMDGDTATSAVANLWLALNT